MKVSEDGAQMLGGGLRSSWSRARGANSGGGVTLPNSTEPESPADGGPERRTPGPAPLWDGTLSSVARTQGPDFSLCGFLGANSTSHLPVFTQDADTLHNKATAASMLAPVSPLCCPPHPSGWGLKERLACEEGWWGGVFDVLTHFS